MSPLRTSLLTAVFGALVLSVPAMASPEPLPRIVLAVDGIGQARNLPLLVAERLGYFRDAGLTVTLVDAPAQPGVDELVTDGRADGGVAYYHHTFMTQTEARVPTRGVVLMGVTPQLRLLVSTRLKDQVRTVADLKGRRIFVGGANSGKTTTMNWLAERAAMTHDAYHTLTPTRPDAMAAALRDGSADAIIAHEPDASRYLASGAAFELSDIATPQGTRAALGAIYPSTALYMTDAFINGHRADVARLVKACLRSLAYINSHSADEIAAILPPAVVGRDRAAFVTMLGQDKQAFATDGRFVIDAAQRQLAVMTARSPKYAAVNLELTYTNAFVTP
ncbi:MAG: ABC transporter substrate-binding protein [Sphingomonadales bacterium]|nr:ABC transporter substrate-binding protein [Sphingomonadales bacterium]